MSAEASSTGRDKKAALPRRAAFHVAESEISCGETVQFSV
jgi:hypothetical protein